jgi:hypothetical protein
MPHVRPAVVLWVVLSVPFVGIATMSAYHHAQRTNQDLVAKPRLELAQPVPVATQRTDVY